MDIFGVNRFCLNCYLEVDVPIRLYDTWKKSVTPSDSKITMGKSSNTINQITALLIKIQDGYRF